MKGPGDAASHQFSAFETSKDKFAFWEGRMSWKQFLREVDRSQRANERTALKRHRELVRERARYEKINAKLAELEAAQAEVTEFESYLDVLVSLHKDCVEPWDWKRIGESKPPNKPKPSTQHQNMAKEVLENYRPGFIDKLLRRVPKRIAALEGKVRDATELDREIDQSALAQYTKELLNWDIRRKLADGVLRQDPETLKRALAHAAPFEELKEFKTRIFLDKVESDVVALTCFLEDEELVPTEELKLTSSGKVSRKDMPAGRYWALHQDYVCSCALRAARETLAVLPVARVIVNVSAKRMDSSVGKTGNTTILGVHCTREAMRGINFAAIDPSDSLKNFNSRMKFKKTVGFEGVAPITTDEAWISA